MNAIDETNEKTAMDIIEGKHQSLEEYFDYDNFGDSYSEGVFHDKTEEYVIKRLIELMTTPKH